MLTFTDQTRSGLFLSLFVFVLFFSVRIIVLNVVKRSKTMEKERKRAWRSSANTFFTVGYILSLLLIWSSEISNFALSFVALGAAFVLATKELLMCFFGSFYKASANLFHIGNRIEINGIRGDVIDKGLLSTTLLEVGPGQTTHQYTGRKVTIPNSSLLIHHVTNESYLQQYVLHTFSIYLDPEEDWSLAESILLESCQNELGDRIEKAQSYMDDLMEKNNLETPIISPKVNIRIESPKEIRLIARITAPYKERGRLEQRILRSFLTEFKKRKALV